MKTLLLTISLLTTLGTYAQNRNLKDNFTVLVREAEGDLNRDGIIDKVIVMMDTIDATVPLRIQISFSQPNSTSKLILSSTRIIEAQYPAHKKGEHNGNQIPNFYIENGNLEMVSDIKNGQSEHKFKFQHGNFELIYFSKVIWDGKNTTTETAFNLITGKRTEKVQSLGSDKIVRSSKNKVLLRPLPKLQNFATFEKELR
ncbi:hypothetical protein [Pedobacter hiemivivus]|uniref:Uncharacterized protein n=1 Tax=Pedobacter hiemivivus TaxID=2530454 RepID=A0A4R0N430_9SPHI|nr:hypothetical protein [Pedobacter hiemivivus]TCC94668.1 hypothetical protein EZ444_16850 [Pedobacter hiemivivus]